VIPPMCLCARCQLPWPCGELLGLLPPQLVAIGAMCLVFWSFAWLMRYFMYFIPVAVWAPGKMKLPLCGLIWAWLVFGDGGL
jgi:hypothetical protein